MTRASTIAYKTVRQLILEGAYAPGQRLLEEELASRVGVSRTSLRDCLRRLSGEGLVRIEANRGTFVASHSSEEIEEIFQLRAVLEGHATALAAVHATAQDLDELTVIATEIDTLLARSDLTDADLFSAFQVCNSRFHFCILRASGSQRLLSMSTALLELPLVTMKEQMWPGQVSVRRSNEQHWEIIQALRSKDPLLSRLLLQTHIMSTRPRVMKAEGMSTPTFL